MKLSIPIILFSLIAFSSCKPKQSESNEKPKINFDSLAMTPPMGWSRWDCLGPDTNEEQIKAVAGYMVEKLKKCGWGYVVIDAGY